MTLPEKAQEIRAETAELRRATEQAFLSSMHTELAVVRTMCILAEPENGEKRAHHIRQAEKAFEMILELRTRVQTNQEIRADIEDARHNIHRLGGRDFSQPKD